MLTFAIKKKRTPSIAPKRHAPSTSPMTHSLHLQQAKVRQILRSPTLQPKLTIGQPNDKYEQEADRVADEMMRMPEQRLQRQAEEEEEELIQTKPLAEQITPLVQRQMEEDEEEEEPIQTKQVSTHTPAVTPSRASRIQSLKGGGQPLPKSARAFFEPRFGYDFSHVRVHTGGKAIKSARGLNAKAFTVGRDIVFGAGHYRPRSSEGQRLLAHELTHVLQQKGTAGSTVRPFSGDADHEAFEKNLEKENLGAADMRFCSKPRLKAGLRIQRFQESSTNPDIIAVRNGPAHAPVTGQDMRNTAGRVIDYLYGMIIEIHVIGALVESVSVPSSDAGPGGAPIAGPYDAPDAGPGGTSDAGVGERRVDLANFIEREQVSESFNHTGAFLLYQGGQSLSFAAQESGWQDAFLVEPDTHALAKTMIEWVADRYGSGSFEIDQLDIYKERGSSEIHVIRYSGYRITHRIDIDSERNITLRISKSPHACDVRGSEGNFRAEGGRSEDGGQASSYSAIVTVREGGDVSERMQPADTAVASRETSPAGEILTVSNSASPMIFRYVSPEASEVPLRPDFPEESSLLYTHDNSTLYGADWEPMPTHVEQGNMGNCWFLAALAALASTEPGKQHIMSHIRPNHEHGPRRSETYTVTLYNGMTGEAYHYRMRPSFPRGYASTPLGGEERGPTAGAIIWVALYERALAHQRGDYESLSGRSGARMGWAFRVITGERSSMEQRITERMERNDLIGIWQDIWNALARGVAVGIVPLPRGGRRNTHAYAVLRAYTIGSQYKLDLYNPWGSRGRGEDYRPITTVEDFADQAIGTGYTNVTYERATPWGGLRQRPAESADAGPVAGPY